MPYRTLARPPGADRLRPGDPDDIERDVEGGGLVWLDVRTREAEEIEHLGHRLALDPAAIEDVLDVEQLPKHEVYDDHLFVVLHALTSVGDRLDTHEVDCFIRPGLLVTVHSEPVLGLDWLWSTVQEHPDLGDTAGELFGQLAEVIGRRFIGILDEFERRVDGLADKALDADRRVLGEIQVLRREESTIRRVMRPQRLVIAALRSNAQVLLDDEAQRILVDAYDVHNLVVESLATTRGLLTDTLDTYHGASAERQASAATILTVYAAILLPLSLITSWYGMNMSLPGADRSWGWVAVTVGMVVLAVGSWIVFLRAGLVGRRPGPAHRGTSLADIARAPVRPFTMLWRPRNGSAGGSGGRT